MMIFHMMRIITTSYHIGCPRILRTDRGTENTNLAFLQPFLRDGDDEFAKEKSFMYGRSTSNRIEFNIRMKVIDNNYSFLADRGMVESAS